MMQRIKEKLKNRYRSSFLYRLTNPRRTHVYCVGTAKSGTNSIGTIFGDQLLSAHEPESAATINLILDNAAGRISKEKLKQYLLERDRRLRLDIDSSQLNFFLLDQLLELFPESKFVLTIRNPYAWLDSLINHSLARTASGEWLKLRDFRFRPNVFSHSPKEQILKHKGLYTLDGYLSYWAGHNRTVIDKVPAERLLIVRTEKISECADEIAAFAGVPRDDFNRDKSHANKARAKYDLLDAIDQEYLEDRIKEHCGALLAEYFPEIRTKSDALALRS